MARTKKKDEVVAKRSNAKFEFRVVRKPEGRMVVYTVKVYNTTGAHPVFVREAGRRIAWPHDAVRCAEAMQVHPAWN